MSLTPRVGLGSSSPCKGEDRWGFAASRFSRTPAATARARRLRHSTTGAERKLWSLLQRAQVGGASFRRQHPIGNYVLDFYGPQLRLAIEVDGGQHDFSIRRAADERRSQWLKSKGITIVRFWNNEVLENKEAVWDEITRVVSALSLRRATPTPTLPLSGGGSNSSEVDR